MAGSNDVSERVINYMLYLKDETLLGTAEIELPELEQITEELTGAGIAGEMETPVLGHYAAMEATIKWRVPEEAAFELAKPKAHEVTARASIQVYDAAKGEYKTVPWRVVMRLVPKNTALGTLAPSSATDTEGTYGVNYIKCFLNNKEVVEIDPLNYKVAFKGEDYLKSVRSDLGLN